MLDMTLLNQRVYIFSILDSEDEEGFKQHQEDADDFLIKKVCLN